MPFLEGIAVPPGAEDAYYAPQLDGAAAPLYEHCARAIDHSLRVGAHGLPLMGSGDWNDGMNRVGHEGRGESVWLAWFLCDVVARFAPLAQLRGQTDRADDGSPPSPVAGRPAAIAAGTASGIGAPSSMTARPSARATTRSAAST